LNLRNTSKALTVFTDEKRVLLLYGIGFNRLVLLKIYNRKGISGFLIDEMVIPTGNKV
jgi:hypothetical protein